MSNDTKYPVRNTFDLANQVVTSLNFWEARQAALEGKTVRRHKEGSTWTIPAPNFLARDFDQEEIAAQWEIVEEPKRDVVYRNLYINSSKNPHFGCYYTTREQALKEADQGSLGVIEIITDENGKLISARNV